MKFDALVFDLDGTLWDVTEACAVGWNDSLRLLRIAKTVTGDDIRRVVANHSVCVSYYFRKKRNIIKKSWNCWVISKRRPSRNRAENSTSHFRRPWRLYPAVMTYIWSATAKDGIWICSFNYPASGVFSKGPIASAIPSGIKRKCCKTSRKSMVSSNRHMSAIPILMKNQPARPVTPSSMPPTDLAGLKTLIWWLIRYKS